MYDILSNFLFAKFAMEGIPSTYSNKYALLASFTESPISALLLAMEFKDQIHSNEKLKREIQQGVNLINIIERLDKYFKENTEIPQNMKDCIKNTFSIIFTSKELEQIKNISDDVHSKIFTDVQYEINQENALLFQNDQDQQITPAISKKTKNDQQHLD